MTLHNWLSKRELGQGGKSPHGKVVKAELCQDIYSSFRCLRTWHPQKSEKLIGGVFNFDFSLDGSVLVAACERQSFLVFDPHNAQMLGCQDKAHADCVNYVRFLDSRLFATCSDDTTVRLWDLRYIKKQIMTMRGHSNWVKNIEYAHSQGLLVTSGFDGSICTWDINNNRLSESVVCNPVFHTNGLMRSRLTQDAEKLIISTTEGYIIVVHDLDLTTLSKDLRGFKPSLCRLVQIKGSPLRQAYSSLFTRKRNRVELISDFPNGNKAEMIASLDVHPQGWCVVSRNTSNDENSEWTCVHDIQGAVEDVELEDFMFSQHSEQLPSISHQINSTDLQYGDSEMIIEPAISSLQQAPTSGMSSQQDMSVLPVQNQWLEVNLPFSTDLENSDTTDETRVQPDVVVNANPQDEERIMLVLHQPAAYETASYCHMHRNRARLLHFIEEPNVGRGFIKEICFSNDGRLICSPFGKGLRMLSFDALYNELCDCVPTSPVQLHEVVTNMNQGGIVVSNKFSPTDALLVTGCLEGKVSFHQPVW